MHGSYPTLRARTALLPGAYHRESRHYLRAPDSSVLGVGPDSLHATVERSGKLLGAGVQVAVPYYGTQNTIARNHVEIQHTHA